MATIGITSDNLYWKERRYVKFTGLRYNFPVFVLGCNAEIAEGDVLTGLPTVPNLEFSGEYIPIMALAQHATQDDSGNVTNGDVFQINSMQSDLEESDSIGYRTKAYKKLYSNGVLSIGIHGDYGTQEGQYNTYAYCTESTPARGNIYDISATYADYASATESLFPTSADTLYLTGTTLLGFVAFWSDSLNSYVQCGSIKPLWGLAVSDAYSFGNVTGTFVNTPSENKPGNFDMNGTYTISESLFQGTVSLVDDDWKTVTDSTSTTPTDDDDDDDTTDPQGNAPDPSTHYGGGDGDFDYTSDTIDEPTPPSISYNHLGTAGVWTPTDEQLKAVMEKVWSADVLTAIAQIFANNSPFDAVMSVRQMPFTVESSGTATMALGTVSTGVEVNIASTQFKTITYTGTVKHFTGDFFDYEPYTHISIHLPFIGIMGLDTNLIMGKTITVKYIIDITTGCLICGVSNDKGIIYTYQSTCGYDIPVTAMDTRNQSRNFAEFAVSSLGKVASGGVTGPLGVVATAASGALTGGAELRQSGSVGGTAGSFDSYDVYLIYKCPDVSYITKSHPGQHGYKSSGVVTLSTLKGTGYTRIKYINPHIVGATQAELDEIKNVMTGSGVIL